MKTIKYFLILIFTFYVFSVFSDGYKLCVWNYNNSPSDWIKVNKVVLKSHEQNNKYVFTDQTISVYLRICRVLAFDCHWRFKGTYKVVASGGSLAKNTITSGHTLQTTKTPSKTQGLQLNDLTSWNCKPTP